MRSILLLPLVARCIETIDVCIWRMFVFMSVVRIVWGSVEIGCCAAAVVKDSGLFEPWRVEVWCMLERGHSSRYKVISNVS